MTAITPDRLAKIPKWAQDEIARLRYEVAQLTGALAAVNSEGQGAFSFTKSPGLPPVHVDIHSMNLDHDGLRVSLYATNGVMVMFEATEPGFMAAVVPQASNCVRIGAFKRGC